MWVWAGTSSRARMYLPTPSRNQLGIDGEPVNGVVNAMDAYGSFLMNGLLGAGSIWVWVLAYKSLGPTSVWASNPIVKFTSQKKWATQRKSGDYGKENPVPWLVS